MSGCAFACAANSGGGGYLRSSSRMVSIAGPWALTRAILSRPVLRHGGTLPRERGQPAPERPADRQHRGGRHGNPPWLPAPGVPAGAGEPSRLEIVRVVRQTLAAVLGDEHQVLEPATAVPVAVEAGLPPHHAR